MRPFVEAITKVTTARKKIELIENSLKARGFDDRIYQLERLDEVEAAIASLRNLILGFGP